jgi:hypothetical protein
MLTGCGTPYLHNGIMSADEEDATNFEVGPYNISASSGHFGKLISSFELMKINSMNVKHNIYLYLRNTHTVK